MPPWVGILGIWERYGLAPWDVFGTEGGRYLWFIRAVTLQAGVEKGDDLRRHFESRKGSR